MSSPLNRLGRNVPSNIPNVWDGKQQTTTDINLLSQAIARNAVVSVVGSGYVASGTSGTSIVLPNQPFDLHPWQCFVRRNKVFIRRGTLINGDVKSVKELEELGRSTKGDKTKVPLTDITCTAKGQEYHKDTRTFSFDRDSNNNGVVYLTLSDGAKIEYSTLTSFMADPPVRSIILAYITKEGKVVQLFHSDIVDSTDADTDSHPYKVTGGLTKDGTIRVSRGCVFGYPNLGTWFGGVNIPDTKPPTTPTTPPVKPPSGTPPPKPKPPTWGKGEGVTNQPTWDKDVPKVGAKALDDGNQEFPSKKYGKQFVIYLKFERNLNDFNVRKPEEQPDGSMADVRPFDWADSAGDFNGWTCSLCVGESVPKDEVKGNYNPSVLAPNWKYLLNGDAEVQNFIVNGGDALGIKQAPNRTISGNLTVKTITQGISIGDGVLVPPTESTQSVPITITETNNIRAGKMYSYGKAHYLVASVKMQEKDVWVDKEGNPVPNQDTPPTDAEKVIMSVPVVKQNLRSDFFFTPPLDGYWIYTENKIIGLTAGTLVIGGGGGGGGGHCLTDVVPVPPSI